MFLLYNLVLTLLSPIWVPWMLIRSRRREESVNWKERCGDIALSLAGPPAKRLWIHAVSVGEVIASKPILRELRNLAPDLQIVLSVTTSSGHKTARTTASQLYDQLIYFPIDVARFQLAAMTRIRPSVVAVMETELWMNFLWAAKSVNATTMVINGRISDRSFPRSRRIAFFYRALFKNLDFSLMQTALDAERISALGAKNVEVLGNCKFDEAIEGVVGSTADWRVELGIPKDALVVVIGSTRGESEDAFVVEAFADSRFEEIWIIHAPRHLESVPKLADLIEARIERPALRSRGESGRYLILDTYGELSSIYSSADLVIIGGGFENHGGQNLIQPLAHGKPVIHGPHMQNFAEVSRLAQSYGCAHVAKSPTELANAAIELLNDKKRRSEMSKAALRLISENTGAARRYAERILMMLK